MAKPPRVEPITVTTPQQFASLVADQPDQILFTADAAHFISRLTIMHNRPYSPFAQLAAQLGGTISAIVKRDFSTKSGGTQAIDLLQPTPNICAEFAVDATDATIMISALSREYTLEVVGSDYLATKFVVPHAPQTMPAKYEQYLKK